MFYAHSTTSTRKAETAVVQYNLFVTLPSMEVNAPSLCKKLVAIALIALVVGNQRNPSRTLILSLIQPGATPLYISSQNGHSEVVQCLLAAGANVNTREQVRQKVHMLRNLCHCYYNLILCTCTYQGCTN